MTPAISLAKEGFLIDAATADSLNEIVRKTRRKVSPNFIAPSANREAVLGEPATV